MKTKEEIIIKLEEVRAEYERELKLGSEELATDRAHELHGEIRSLMWVLNILL